ncbi:DUF599 domain-containing protein [Candidatus Woesearchaeota archaeon]|nr:DUF599 domain-containing protein [Candidatus Woesearchaeota archaeon]
MGDLETIALLVYLLSVAVYCFFLYYTLQKQELQTYRSKINAYRREWLKKQFAENRYENIINVIRNSIVAASSLGSALIIMLGFIINKVPMGEELGPKGLLGFVVANKLFLICIMLFLSIYFLFMHIRLLSRFTFLAGTGVGVVKKVEGEEGLAYLSSMLNRAMNQFSYAIRCLYFAVIAVVWLFSPVLFIFCTIALTVGLIYRESFAKVEFV